MVLACCRMPTDHRYILRDWHCNQHHYCCSYCAKWKRKPRLRQGQWVGPQLRTFTLLGDVNVHMGCSQSNGRRRTLIAIAMHQGGLSFLCTPIAIARFEGGDMHHNILQHMCMRVSRVVIKCRVR